MTIRVSVACGALLACVLGAAAYAVDASMVQSANGIQWGPAPPSLPPGAQLAVMAGNPASSGFVSLRAKLPAGYVIPPHTHPTDEHATVLSGTMAFGMGDKVSAAGEQSVGVGGYFTAKTGMHHYAVAKTDAVIQVDLMGPFAINYINPADDPRNKH